MELAGKPSTFSQEIPPVADEGAEVLEAARGPDCRQVTVPESDPSDEEGVNGVGLGVVALVPSSQRGQLGWNFHDMEATALERQGRLSSQASGPFDPDANGFNTPSPVDQLCEAGTIIRERPALKLPALRVDRRGSQGVLVRIDANESQPLPPMWVLVPGVAHTCVCPVGPLLSSDTA